MKMLGIGLGDEVITSAYSWISSSETISQTGAKPIFVDIDEYFTIDETKIEASITSRTKAILPVHIHGQMCEMEKIVNIAKKHNLFIIEDCAQSHFSAYKYERAGTIGIAGSFSFYPGKNLGAYGDAGCIITNNDEFAKKCRMFANHGALKKHHHEIEGINSRLDGLQAAILSAKLPHILNWTEARRKNAVLYNQHLASIINIELPKIRCNTLHSFHLFVIKVEKRDELQNFLKEKGVETAIHYPTALVNLPCYLSHDLKACGYPNATGNQSTILSLPMFPELNEIEIKYIANCITSFYAT
jgi:dTDP-4-amino-4,6-dideoxygalactose transaminase